MSQHQRLSNEPTRYDQTRVARLKPIEKAIERLRLPPIRARKLGAVLSALEVQIEDGGDSPEANRFLLEALRAGVRHQVEEDQAWAVLRAIETLERAEAERWEQVRAGTLPPTIPSTEDQLDELMQEGYDLQQADRLAAACDRWLEAWELVKRLARPEWRTTDAFDRTYGLTQSIFNWCQDLEMELGNAGLRQPIYHEHRLRYAREFLLQFPDEDALFQVNFTRAQGEALGWLDRPAEAEAVFEALVSRLPDEAWGYIGWSDNYWLFRDSPKEYDRAVAILKRALARPSLNDRPDVLERLEDLYREWGKPEEEVAVAAQREQLAAGSETRRRPASTPAPVPVPAPASAAALGPKLSRNAPCWCGSGKRYKRCHMSADQTTRP